MTPSPSSPEPSRGDRADGDDPDDLRAQWAATLDANHLDLLRLHLRAEVVEALVRSGDTMAAAPVMACMRSS